MTRPTQLAIGPKKVDLGEDIDMGQLDLEHGPEGEEKNGDVLGRICTVMRIDQMDRAELRYAAY